MDSAIALRSRLGISGELTGTLDVPGDEWHLPRVRAEEVWWQAPDGLVVPLGTSYLGEAFKLHARPRGARLCVRHRNGFVNLGLVTAAARWSGTTFGAGIPAAAGWMGIASDSSTVTRTVLFLGGAAAVITSGGTQNGSIKACTFAITGSPNTNAAVVNTASATFTEADMAGARFIINKVGVLNASTDVGSNANASGVQDVIGGTGGAAPYDQNFQMNFVNLTTFTQALQIAVTFAAI